MDERITRFGTELEICYAFEDTDHCLKVPMKSMDEKPFKNYTFFEKFDIFYHSILKTSPQFKAIRDKYMFIAAFSQRSTRKEAKTLKRSGKRSGSVSTRKSKSKPVYYREYRLYDLFEPDAPPKVMRDNKDPDMEYIKEYRVPIVTDDYSVKCGDAEDYTKHAANILIPRSFQFELVTPILEVKGEVTKEKVQAVLKPLLMFFGLSRPACFFANRTAGFHVNVSLQKDAHPLELDATEFRKILIEDFKPLEDKFYPIVRERTGQTQFESEYAKRLSDRYNALKAIKEKGGKVPMPYEDDLIDEFAKYPREIQYKLYRVFFDYTDDYKRMTYDEFLRLNSKYYAIYAKNEHVLEFRLFQSEVNWNRLITYTYQTLHFLNKAYDKYLRYKVIGP